MGFQGHTNDPVVDCLERSLQCALYEEISCESTINAFSSLSFLNFRIAAISMASKITDMQLGDSVEISKLITKKEIHQAR